MDSITIIGVIAGFTGMFVAVLTHLKHSDCCKGFLTLDTRSQIISPSPSPSPIISPFISPIIIEKESHV